MWTGTSVILMPSPKQVVTVSADHVREDDKQSLKTLQVKHIWSDVCSYLQPALWREVSTQQVFMPILEQKAEMCAEDWTATLTPDGVMQGVTNQANSSLKHILEQHGITGTPTLLQQLVSTPPSCLPSATGLTVAIIRYLLKIFQGLSVAIWPQLSGKQVWIA